MTSQPKKRRRSKKKAATEEERQLELSFGDWQPQETYVPTFEWPEDREPAPKPKKKRGRKG